jgi:hypothetical protein
MQVDPKSEGLFGALEHSQINGISVAITLDLYSHVLPGLQADAAARIDDAVRTAIDRRREPNG